MNKKLVFSVFDSKAEAFLSPFAVDSQGLAVRWFQGLVLTPEHDFNRFAEDFTLFELGSFDTKSGMFSLHDGPRSVCNALQLRKDS